jgi:hypothetical protein
MKKDNLVLYLSVAIALFNTLPVLGQSTVEGGDAVLKPDVPKLGRAKKKVPLKGSVQHSEKIGPKSALNGNAKDGNDLNGKAAANNDNLFRGKAKHDKSPILNAETESGIGIIGVKFVLGFGRPPIINRVFPGTPASENGLRPNDIIVAVDGIPTYGLTKDEVYNMIVGTPHTPVSISFLRNKDFQVRKMDRMDFNDITDPRVRRDYQSM